jgi:hypothetical protein
MKEILMKIKNGMLLFLKEKANTYLKKETINFKAIFKKGLRRV